jgi:hypothetical protein
MSNDANTNRPIAENAIVAKYPEISATYSDAADLTGTVELQASGALVGTGTAFTTELAVDDIIEISGSNAVYKIASITDDTTATITDTAAATVAAGATASIIGDCTTTIGQTLDLVAAQGRLYWRLIIDCAQDVTPIVDYLNNVLDGQGYTITSVTEPTYSYVQIFIPPVTTT